MLTSLNKYNNKMTIEQTIDRLVIVDLLRKSRKKGWLEQNKTKQKICSIQI